MSSAITSSFWRSWSSHQRRGPRGAAAPISTSATTRRPSARDPLDRPGSGDDLRPHPHRLPGGCGQARAPAQAAEVDLTHGVGALPDVVERGGELPPVPRPRRPLQRGAQLLGRDEPLLDACRHDPARRTRMGERARGEHERGRAAVQSPPGYGLDPRPIACVVGTHGLPDVANPRTRRDQHVDGRPLPAAQAVHLSGREGGEHCPLAAVQQHDATPLGRRRRAAVQHDRPPVTLPAPRRELGAHLVVSDQPARARSAAVTTGPSPVHERWAAAVNTPPLCSAKRPRRTRMEKMDFTQHRSRRSPGSWPANSTRSGRGGRAILDV